MDFPPFWICQSYRCITLIIIHTHSDTDAVLMAIYQVNLGQETTHKSVPRVHIGFRSLSFSVAAPIIWNSLPLDIRNSSTISCFCCQLKTLFYNAAFRPPYCPILALSQAPQIPVADIACFINSSAYTYLLTLPGLASCHRDSHSPFVLHHHHLFTQEWQRCLQYVRTVWWAGQQGS